MRSDAVLFIDLQSIVSYIKDIKQFNAQYIGHTMRSSATDTLPLAARKALAKLGEDIAVARKKRRISTVSMAERAFISRKTLHKLERGDPTVSIGIYATVLSILNLIEKLGDVAERSTDDLGLDIEEDNLPGKIKLRSRR